MAELASIAVSRQVQTVGGRRLVMLAAVSCPSSGSCQVSTPGRVGVTIAGKRYWAKVIAPRVVEAGGSAAVRAKLPKAALKALGSGRATLRVRIVVRSGDQVAQQIAKVKISGPVKTRSVSDSGLVTLGRIRCTAARTCAVKVPGRVAAKAGGRTVGAKVIAPRSVAGWKAAKVEVKLGRGALRRLAGHSAIFRVRAVLRSGGSQSVQVIEARLERLQGGSEEDIPTSGPISAEPPLLARPATAIDVSDVKLTWYPRDSWVRYASSGVAARDGILVSGGALGRSSTASACPDRASSSDAQLPYAIDFAPRASWYDPVSGTAGVYGQGSVAFRWKAHKIDLAASEPEIEINGAASRAIFRFSGREGTAYPDQRAPLVSLDLGGQPIVGNGGRTFTYSLMRGTLTGDGVNVFAGFYTPPSNDEFGCVSVAFTTP